MRLVVSFILILTFTALGHAASLYSVSEGYLDKGHDPALNKYRQKYFYGKGQEIDPIKLDGLMQFLEYQKSNLMDSAKMNRKVNLIVDHGYENDEAEKEGLEAQSSEAETIAPLIFALEHTRDLRSRYRQMSMAETHEKVELILLFLGAGYTPYPTTIFTNLNERFKNLKENFFEFPIDESNQVQASNLLLDGLFASQMELKRYQREGGDISKLNPPSSAIWNDNDIGAYNPYEEVYWGKKMFPPREVDIPVFYYKRMGNGTVKFKTFWLDPKDLNKKGLPKKKDVTLRVGIESYNASVVNHLARIIGYPANPTTFRSAIKLELGDVGFEEFLTQWKIRHGNGMGSAITHIERIPGENAVLLKNVTLEAYPDDDEYRRMGPFRMGDNGLRNRREYRAMVLYNSLISLQDHFEYQSRVDAIKDTQKGWRPLFYISDTSAAMGLPAMLGNVGTVNEYTWEFTRRNHEQVRLFWFSVFNSRTWKDTTYSDVKWLARRLAKVRTDQIDAIMETSGFPAPAQLLFKEKIKSRLNKMMIDFDLIKEGYQLHPVLSMSDLSAAFPQYINGKGQLKEGAQEFPGNTLPILGERFTPLQAVVVYSINALQNKFLSLFNPDNYADGNFTIDLGNQTVEGGIGFESSRSVQVNPELGPGQHRYLLNDKVSISIPVGLLTNKVTTPVALCYTYTFEYYHSVATMKEVGTSRFFAMLNPFSIRDIRRTLSMGEQLRVTHSFGANVGRVKIKVIDDIEVEAALVGLGLGRIKSVYFSKTAPSLLEISTDHMKVASVYSGIDIRSYVRLAANARAQSTDKVHYLYRLDLLNQTPSQELQLQNAFEDALVDDDFSFLERMVVPHKWVEFNNDKNFSLSFFVWNRSFGKSLSHLVVNGQRLVVAHKNDTFDRSFSRVWTDKVSGGIAEPAANYFGEFWGEGKHLGISFEGLVGPDRRRLSEMEMTITLSMFDNYCTREEFEEDFKKFFNLRSGSPRYIRFLMPPELSAYPELEGTMKWQISYRGLRDILRASTSESNLYYLGPEDGPKRWITQRAENLLKALDRKIYIRGNAYLFGDQASDLMYVISRLIGKKGEHVGRLRRFTGDENLWVTTGITNMLEISNPTFRHQKESFFWAPEIGKYQGHSFLDRFRRTVLLEPIYR